MIGPTLSFRLPTTRVSIGFFDVVLCAVILFGAIPASVATPNMRIGAVVLLTAIFFAAAFVAERSRLVLAGHSNPLEVISLHLIGAISVSAEESANSSRATRGGVAGALISGAIIAVFLPIALTSRTTDSFVGSALFAFAMLMAGAAAIQLFPVSGLDGGRLFGFFVENLFEDEDSGAGAIVVYGFIASMLPVVAGVAIGLSAEPQAYWGFAMVAAGLECLILGPRYRAQLRWLGTASKKLLRELTHSSLPIVRTNAPVSELLAIVSIEGANTTVVVQDEVGRPVGVIQMRQLRGATRRKSLHGVDEVMLGVEKLPKLASDKTVLEGRLYLEKSGWRAAVYDGRDGKPHIVSLDELLAL